MKKSFIVLLIIASFGILTAGLPVTTNAKTAPVKKTKVIAKPPTTLKWDAAATKRLNNLASFDYSYTIRNAFIKKIENYAKSKKVKTITIQFLNNAHI